jgi:hypothetical protein
MHEFRIARIVDEDGQVFDFDLGDPNEPLEKLCELYDFDDPDAGGEES